MKSANQLPKDCMINASQLLDKLLMTMTARCLPNDFQKWLYVALKFGNQTQQGKYLRLMRQLYRNMTET